MNRSSSVQALSAGVLQKKFSKNFVKIYGKTPVSQSKL